MPRRTVDSAQDAEAIVNRVEAAMYDLSPFFEQLEKARVFEISEREVWDKRFGMNLRHTDATITLRRLRRGYYANAPDERAGPASPWGEWRGGLRRAASRFTTISTQRASIDPDFNYREDGGPISMRNAFSTIISEVVPDEKVWPEKIIGPRFDRELTSYLNRLVQS